MMYLHYQPLRNVTSLALTNISTIINTVIFQSTNFDRQEQLRTLRGELQEQRLNSAEVVAVSLDLFSWVSHIKLFQMIFDTRLASSIDTSR